MTVAQCIPSYAAARQLHAPQDRASKQRVSRNRLHEHAGHHRMECAASGNVYSSSRSCSAPPSDKLEWPPWVPWRNRRGLSAPSSAPTALAWHLGHECAHEVGSVKSKQIHLALIRTCTWPLDIDHERLPASSTRDELSTAEEAEWKRIVRQA